jgi:RNA-binding protein 39
MHQLGITVPKLLNLIQQVNVYAGAISGWKPLAHTIPQCPLPTKVLILTNMWQEDEIKSQSNLIELKEEVESNIYIILLLLDECKKYGDIDMVWIDQKLEGNVLVVFKSVHVAVKVKEIMNNRKFSDRTVQCYYITEV